MCQFDIKLNAKTTIKERIVWMLYMGIVFFLLYGAANQYALLSAPHSSFAFEWEKNIPFIEVFIIPYMTTDLVFVLAFLLPYTRLELRVLALRVFSIIIFSVIMFLIFPISFGFDKPDIHSFKWLFNLLKADLPFNQAPSLHVGFAIVLYFSMKTKIKFTIVRIFLAFWFILIVLSTLFVYQHHFIDLPTGASAGFLAVYFISSKKENCLLQTFTTPRHLKMALYYLLGAIFFMLLTFNVSVLFLYPFVSLFLVSVIYAFGLNTLLTKVYLYPIFFPYFLGNQLTWLYYKQKLPLMVYVKEKVYFGRKPMFKESGQFVGKFDTIIDLAPEHFYSIQGIFKIIKLPFLDQTIPDPKLLHKAVLLIEKYKNQGVYVHCALGLSRSVLVIFAWLLYNGESQDEIEKLIKKIRPNYIKSTYMQIALDIYKKQIKR